LSLARAARAGGLVRVKSGDTKISVLAQAACRPLRGAYRQGLPGIGSFSVRFRWFIVVAWLVAAGLVPHFLPSLASVTQGNNADYLPASAPGEHAAKLATPFGTSNVTPVLILAARTSAPLTAADQTWLAGLQKDLRSVRTVTLVRNLGASPEGHAEQVEALSNVSQGDSTAVINLIDGLRSAISRAGPPSS
jgi:uncharacterized membrane protein YdfJ with MMPL/SSD domain